MTYGGKYSGCYHIGDKKGSWQDAKDYCDKLEPGKIWLADQNSPIEGKKLAELYKEDSARRGLDYMKHIVQTITKQ